jgi:hypothetical protein
VSVIDRVERPRRVFVGGELEILLSDLDYHRSTLLWKCEGLTDEQLRRRAVPPSELSLLGLLRHLTGAERHWFQEVPLGIEVEPIYPDAGGGQWDDILTPAKEVVGHFQAACDESRRVAATRDLEEVLPSENFGPVSFRFVLVHMVEEYGRHCGHADLLRESIDGAVGE